MIFSRQKITGGTWSQPENLGYPVNSVKDDIYIVSTGKKYVTDALYFSSDRSSECCLELYAASKRSPAKRLAGLVSDCATGLPLEGAAVTITNVGNTPVAVKTTNSTGQYELAVEEFQPLKITATKPGYLPNNVLVSSPANEMDTIVSSSFCIEKPPYVENKPAVVEKVYFDFNEAILKQDSYVVLDTVVALMKRYPAMLIEVRGHTDSKGSDQLNQALSEARAKAFSDYLISKGIEADRLTSVGFGATIPIAPNTLPDGKDNPAGREKNRRTEIKVLHY